MTRCGPATRNLFTTLAVGLLAVGGCGGDSAERTTSTVAATTTSAPLTPPPTTVADYFQNDEQRAAVQTVERQIDLFLGITEQQLGSFLARTGFAKVVDFAESKYVPSPFESLGPYGLSHDAGAYMLAVSLGTFRMVAANGDELVIMPIGIMNRKAEGKVILYTLADAYVPPTRRPVGAERVRQWQWEAFVAEGLADTVTVNGEQIQTVTYPVGNYRFIDDVSIGYIGELPADYFSPPGALPVLALAYANSPDNFGGEDGYRWYGLDPAKMQQLFLAIEGASTKTTADDVPGVYSVTSDAHVPINEINELASYRNAQENLVSILGLRLIPAMFPG